MDCCDVFYGTRYPDRSISSTSYVIDVFKRKSFTEARSHSICIALGVIHSILWKEEYFKKNLKEVISMCQNRMFDSPYDLLLKRYPFVLDTVYCSCLVSFFQAVKFQQESTRVFVCKIREEDDLERIRDIGSSWKQNQVLHWRGVDYYRDSEEFSELIRCAFRSANLHPEFQNVLLASGYQFLDRIARPSNPLQTVLTKAEAVAHFLEIKSFLVDFRHRMSTSLNSQSPLLQ